MDLPGLFAVGLNYPRLHKFDCQQQSDVFPNIVHLLWFWAWMCCTSCHCSFLLLCDIMCFTLIHFSQQWCTQDYWGAGEHQGRRAPQGALYHILSTGRAITAHLCSVQDTHMNMDAAVPAYPSVIPFVFWSVLWKLHVHGPNGARGQCWVEMQMCEFMPKYHLGTGPNTCCGRNRGHVCCCQRLLTLIHPFDGNLAAPPRGCTAERSSQCKGRTEVWRAGTFRTVRMYGSIFMLR